ncbi:phosphonate ABC transporter, permease protein PhnE [Phytoactinopolyspora alkaliphila]|uniref:Phosphonate ABC transporter, permease protein PhnE n=1 Tax=Phytoactinopolyspora alkaliphila TaxID=1783498 RepID=A0A6N9YTG5_9ACTN|nr:phosphonate ABC transporter, permease protein PhnE [Phytoactinopolyspora alkaliphila]NED98109.1 phosphonate ABC transporter, permease protein PhnE [Phytoactinopolyspora alkaliphila]
MARPIESRRRTTVPGSRPQPPSKTRKTIGFVAGTAVIVACLLLVDARWENLSELPGNLGNYVSLMADGVLSNPLEDPETGYWQRAFELMLESLYMAWVGTMIGAVVSFPLGFLAAENISPRPVVLIVRQILNAIRAIPELIFAIAVMLPIFGFGPAAGALALGVGSVGTLGKLTAEVIEGIDRGPVEAARATGARQLQILRWGVVPQALPEVVAFWLYRFEINIRASAILGVLAAGGIGSLLSQLFAGTRQWDRIGITLVVIIVVTIVVDLISAAVRHRIISGGKQQLVEVAETSSIPAAS